MLGHCVGDEPWKLCSTQSQTLTCACHSTGVQSALFGGWLVRFPHQLQTDYWAVQTYIWASKPANRRVNSALSALSFSTNCTWKHIGRDLLFNVLVAWKMAQCSFNIWVSHRPNLVWHDVAWMSTEGGSWLTRQRTSKGEYYRVNLRAEWFSKYFHWCKGIQTQVQHRWDDIIFEREEPPAKN